MELHALPNKCAPEERWGVFEKLILHRLDVLDEQAREGRKEHDDIKQDLTILKTRLSYLGVAATALPTIAGILYLIFGR